MYLTVIQDPTLVTTAYSVFRVLVEVREEWWSWLISDKVCSDMIHVYLHFYIKPKPQSYSDFNLTLTRESRLRLSPEYGRSYRY